MAREVVYSSENNHQGAILFIFFTLDGDDWPLELFFSEVAFPGGQGLLSFISRITVSKKYFPVQQVSIINFTCMIRVKYCLDRKSLETKEINKSL